MRRVFLAGALVLAAAGNAASFTSSAQQRDTPGVRSVGVPSLAAPVGDGDHGGERTGPGESKPGTAKPEVRRLRLARGVKFDVRQLKGQVVRKERPEHEPPNRFGHGDADESDESEAAPTAPSESSGPSRLNVPSPSGQAAPSAPAPPASSNFAGLDFATWGQGHPPDTNGDVGPTYYIQTINASLGIFEKSTGIRVAAFTFNSFMSQGNFGNLCDTNNVGDPVVLYDSFEDRWIITDFAFKVDGSGNVSPQQVFECFAVSKSGDPVTGGWNFYSVEAPGGLADYPKFGVWSDGIYMAANMFGYATPFPYLGAHVWGFDKAEMYAGASSVDAVDFAVPDASDFTLLPANARLQTGTPPNGRNEFFVSTWQNTSNEGVYTLDVDWANPFGATFSGPTYQHNASSWPNATVPFAATPANSNDTLGLRAMAQAQYSHIGADESLWVSHTVRRGSTTGFAAPRWYQLGVTGGTIAADTTQGTTWDPDGSNLMYRYMPSLAVDRLGDLALGYTSSNSTTNPRIDYAGRLAADPPNTFSQGEQTLIAGTGSQSGNCGGAVCHRWGDYSGMALDPDGCRFWMTNEYYATTGLNHQTRIGAFQFPGCTTVGNGTLNGTVSRTGGSPLAGATVSLGSRTTTSDVDGHYSFTVPSGTYPLVGARKTGFDPASATDVAVPNAGTTTRNFTLSPKAGAYTAVNPFRLLDTRNGIGAPDAQVGAGQTVTFQVTGLGGVPGSGAAAAVVNVTVTKGTKAGFVTAFPTGSVRPGTSNVSFAAGQTIATHTTVKLSTGGQVSLFNGSSAPIDLIADVAGWYRNGSVTDQGMFTPLVGARLANAIATAANATLPVQVASTAGIPGSASVGAGAFNVTVTGPTAAGFITAFPNGTTRPNASNVNFLAGQTIANAAATKLVNGKLSLFNGSAGTTKITADVSGWFTSGTATLAGGFTSVNPARILDTRNGIGAVKAQVPAGGTVTLTVANHGGVPSSGADAAVMNVTVTRGTASGYVTAFPTGTTRPNASNVNFVAGQTIPNLVTVKLGTGGSAGKVTFFNGSTKPVDVLADVAGWYHS